MIAAEGDDARVFLAVLRDGLPRAVVRAGVCGIVGGGELEVWVGLAAGAELLVALTVAERGVLVLERRGGLAVEQLLVRGFDLLDGEGVVVGGDAYVATVDDSGARGVSRARAGREGLLDPRLERVVLQRDVVAAVEEEAPGARADAARAETGPGTVGRGGVEGGAEDRDVEGGLGGRGGGGEAALPGEVGKGSDATEDGVGGHWRGVSAGRRRDGTGRTIAKPRGGRLPRVLDVSEGELLPVGVGVGVVVMLELVVSVLGMKLGLGCRAQGEGEEYGESWAHWSYVSTETGTQDRYLYGPAAANVQCHRNRGPGQGRAIGCLLARPHNPIRSWQYGVCTCRKNAVRLP